MNAKNNEYRISNIEGTNPYAQRTTHNAPSSLPPNRLINGPYPPHRISPFVRFYT